MTYILFWALRKNSAERKKRDQTRESESFEPKECINKYDVLENETYYKKNIFTETELNFYRICKMIADEQNLEIFPKMTLKEILYVKDENGNKNPYKYFSKIDKKHIDYTIYDPVKNDIIVCIELDDSSHQRDDRVKRDVYVDAVLYMAGINLVRIPAQRSYNINEIKGTLGIYKEENCS